MKQEAAANFSFVEPMQALPVNDLPAGGWLYEMKFDWYRALAFKAGKEVRLFSRNRTNFNDNYPQLVDALKSLRPKTSSSTARSLRWTTTAGLLFSSSSRTRSVKGSRSFTTRWICSVWMEPICGPERLSNDVSSWQSC